MSEESIQNVSQNRKEIKNMTERIQLEREFQNEKIDLVFEEIMTENFSESTVNIILRFTW